MNKEQILNLLLVFRLSANAQKSVANRIESALSKNLTPAQMLSSASQSLRKRAEELDKQDPDYGAIEALASALDFAREMVNAGKEATKSKKREYWAESQEEAQALKAKAESAKTAPKPKKVKAEAPATASDLDLETARALLQALLASGR